MRYLLFCVAVVSLVINSTSGFADSRLTVEVVDSATGAALPARVYLTDAEGKAHFLQSAATEGTAYKYDKGGAKSPFGTLGERHTTVSAHPAFVDVAPGEYRIEVERGKEYLTAMKAVTVGGDATTVKIPLTRWVNMAERGWYSGETHVHRLLDELKNVALAEDLNVTFPLSYWVITSDTPPSAGNRAAPTEVPDTLMTFDETHVAWPRNTEYEIFSVGDKRHTLGAYNILNHKTPFATGVPPWGPVIEQARKEGAFFDMEKFAWPFEATLPVLAPESLYELSNNHLWRSGLFFRNWYTPAPPYMQPPYGGKSGNERQWIDFTFGMYYTLLNTGLKIAPTAGSANGVLSTPMGYSRVYVNTPGKLDYDKWVEGLKAGRSFVTTGPMLIATANGKPPGETFESDGKPIEIALNAELHSQYPIVFSEVLINGLPERMLRGTPEKQADGTQKIALRDKFKVAKSGWIAVRSYEERPNGRTTFAHTAPWYVQVGKEKVKPRLEETMYLVGRMRDEIERSKGVVSIAAMAEYEKALRKYEAMATEDDSEDVKAQSRKPKSDAELDRWVINMTEHQFDMVEMRTAMGLPLEDLFTRALRLNAAEKRAGVLRVLPYPGGRHPRIGFRDGALRPLRDTKLSVFAPWEGDGYAVVDLPEAVFSNLGLMYLAHTHVQTIWEKEGKEVPRTDWVESSDGTFTLSLSLPNGVMIGSKATPKEKSVAMELSLTNGTKEPLTEMRAQVCVMLKGAVGFNDRTNTNKIFDGPFVAVGSEDKKRWIITAWTPIQRAWGNPPVPCLHSDPFLPDCAPGETVKATGELWFYEGSEIGEELARLKSELAKKSGE